MKLYLQSVNTDTSCDGVGPYDLSETVGSGSISSVAIDNTSFMQTCSFDIEKPDDANPGAFTADVSLNVSAVDSNAEYRFRVSAVNAACAVVTSTGWSALFTTAGVKTATLSMTWPASAARIRVGVEIRRTSGIGAKNLNITAGASSFVVARWVSRMEMIRDAIVARLTGVTKAAGYHNDLSAEQVVVGSLTVDQITKLPALLMYAIEWIDRVPEVLGDTSRQRRVLARYLVLCLAGNVDSPQKVAIRLAQDVVSAVERDPFNLGFDSDTVEGVGVGSGDQSSLGPEVAVLGAVPLIITVQYRCRRGRL